MAAASDWNMSWWHETAALAAFCPIIHQHLPPTEPVKGCLRLFVVLQEVSSRMPLLHPRLGFLSHLASAMSSERRFLQALCHEGRKLPATSVLCRDDDTACLHACSLTICYAFVAHAEKAYWLPLPSKNTHEKNNSFFLPWICCSWVLTWIKIGIFRGSTLGWAMGMEKYRTPRYLQFSFVWKRWTQVLPRVLFSHQVQGTPSCSRRQQMLLLFLLRAWFLFPLKNTLNQHAATQYPKQGEREERKSLANESFMHMAQPHHRSPKELARDPCGHQTAVILSRPFQFKVCETLPPQLQLPMALIHGAKSTHASCSHLRQRDFND